MFQAADYAGGTFALIGILSALHRRRSSGEGACLDIAMFDGLLAMGDIALTGALARANGQSGAPMMEVWGGNPRYAIYPTADGRFVAVSLLERRLWARFCDVIGRPDLVFDDEKPEHRHSDHGERAADYRGALSAYCASHSAAATGPSPIGTWIGPSERAPSATGSTKKLRILSLPGCPNGTIVGSGLK